MRYFKNVLQILFSRPKMNKFYHYNFRIIYFDRKVCGTYFELKKI